MLPSSIVEEMAVILSLMEKIRPSSFGIFEKWPLISLSKPTIPVSHSIRLLLFCKEFVLKLNIFHLGSYSKVNWIEIHMKEVHYGTTDASELKGRHAAQSIPTKKRRDLGDKDQSKHASDYKDGCADDFSFLPISTTVPENSEELRSLKDQVVSEKDSVAKSTQQQLSDAKIMLADKQADLEKLKWKAMTSNTRAEKLQENVNTMQAEISSIMILCEGLRKNYDDVSTEDYDVPLNYVDHIPDDVDSLDELKMQRMEDAREAYIAAVAAAKEIQDEYSIAAARSARLHLLSLVIKN
ncbi:hypothetical protein POM88_021575 [Heracleum sosnowskyi]|uniref:Uncharacterized protein n=1 Tax=Heracleum sosnowskyi TaxID=360622 RepID=A0AAD8IDR7_9APIA|nr:hypothetical protein POM88_021575 [Heracleum sosnowskyi]